MITLVTEGNMANSYLSLDEGIEWLGDDFAMLGEEVCKSMLISGSLSLDNRYRFVSKKLDDSQLLKFPRVGIPVNSGVKLAVVAIVLHQMNDDEGITEETSDKLKSKYSKGKDNVRQYVNQYIDRSVRIN